MKPIYYHIQNPFFPKAPDWFYGIWERVFCRRGLHLFTPDLYKINSYTKIGVLPIKCDACAYQGVIETFDEVDYD
jgi:hypothetical protein